MAQDNRNLTDSSDHGERIARLEYAMQDLMGNGQPGRIKQLETAVDKLSRYFWMGVGALALMHFLSDNGFVSLTHIINATGGK